MLAYEYRYNGIATSGLSAQQLGDFPKSPYDKSSSVRYLTVIPLSQSIRSSRYVAKQALCAFVHRYFYGKTIKWYDVQTGLSEGKILHNKIGFYSWLNEIQNPSIDQ
ncbi:MULTISPECIES: hypothetical protein [Clostridia]|uniref:hypothetical protein n=1 Tax=Clostridia TaxID=186801 RepID=UPI000EA0FF6A|nr:MULTISPECIES: hypothetical protein [Clostridia]NBJ69516.1 hypothetical protein [Roseburia sp. 1XD42-34]RKI78588.1 hypothetical protein D7V87_08535 [Clostridium sp. 1xD42-85]